MLPSQIAQAVRTLTRPRALPSLWGAGSQSLRFRHYHQSSALRQPYKDDQDRESLKPRNTESTQSAWDEDAAAHEDAAFNPKKTSPGKEKRTAGKGANGNPLEVSGANQELSKPRGDNPGGETKPPAGKKKKSGGSTGVKHGKV